VQTGCWAESQTLVCVSAVVEVRVKLFYQLAQTQVGA